MKLVTTLSFALLAAVGSASAFAADKAPANTLTPQQQKMSDCSKTAHGKNLQGDDYKSYMSTCMKGGNTSATDAAKPTTAAAGASNAASAPSTAHDAGNGWATSPDQTSRGGTNPQQQKMKACAADAKTQGLKGNDRRAFMSTCLKKDDTTTPAAKPATTAPKKQPKSTTN